jgi:hypothetical protein
MAPTIINVFFIYGQTSPNGLLNLRTLSGAAFITLAFFLCIDIVML